jgi:hypothetical protein
MSSVRTPSPAPTPIPIFAPVLNPEDFWVSGADSAVELGAAVTVTMGAVDTTVGVCVEAVYVLLVG